MEKDPAIYVRHILEAIANIEADIAGYDFERFRVDRRTRQRRCRRTDLLSVGGSNWDIEQAEVTGVIKTDYRSLGIHLRACLLGNSRDDWRSA
jgi:uncharacterized protein with HEPN domain